MEYTIHMDVVNKIDKLLKENTKRRYYVTDKNHRRIGLIHYIYEGDKTVYVDENVSEDDKKKIIDKFEELEGDIYDLIDKKENEFQSFLEKNNFKSSMGSIDYKS